MFFFIRNHIKEKFEHLSKLKKSLEKNSLQLDWDSVNNPSIKSSIKHLPPSEYLENIADVLFQFDISINSISQYFDALNLHDTKSYENFMNSFVISAEISDFVKEFLIKSITLLNRWTGNCLLSFKQNVSSSPNYPISKPCAQKLFFGNLYPFSFRVAKRNYHQKNI